MTTITVTVNGPKVTMQANIAPRENTADMSPPEYLEAVQKLQLEGFLADKVMGLLETGLDNLKVELKRQTELAQWAAKQMGEKGSLGRN